MRAKLLLTLSSLSISLLIVEFLLAEYFPQKTIEYTLANRAGIYRVSNFTLTELIPNFEGREREADFDIAVRINSHGYRQGEFDLAKGDQFRILVVGDSFTFGHGVEASQAYPQVLETLLVGGGHGSVQVVNAGVPARWVDEYFLELMHRGLALQPDLVVVGLFIGNDLDGTDARTHVWPEVDAKGRPIRVDVPDERLEGGYRVQRSRKARWQIPVIRSSHVAQLLYDSGRTIRELIQPNQSKDITIFEPQYEERVQQVVERVETLLLAIAEMCRNHAIPLLIVMLPTREQIEPAARRGLERLDWDKPQRLLGEFFQQHDVGYLDLLAVMRADREPLYLAIDSHWNAHGHAVAAEAIANELTRHGLAGPASNGR